MDLVLQAQTPHHMHTQPIFRNKQPKPHTQAHTNLEFLNIKTSCRLGEILSPGRVTHSPKQQTNLAYTSIRQNKHEHTLRTRLGEPLSPRRECQSLKIPQPRAWARYRAQTSRFSSRPRLGECLSPEQETMSLKPLFGRLDVNHEPELNVRLCNSRLGEMDPLG